MTVWTINAAVIDFFVETPEAWEWTGGVFKNEATRGCPWEEGSIAIEWQEKPDVVNQVRSFLKRYEEKSGGDRQKFLRGKIAEDSLNAGRTA
ncbi:hypothetical protein EVJ58_g9991 [Rhodofomes roseus]|uniref:Uncharacterized protein n=1 Tax=Rhodofomes roseus TaxID=34475 RepID=A0A4Y9XSW9_9APHY|nr:hypothetical protein EVJ58_g9991 [Rhodofomes roseus]